MAQEIALTAKQLAPKNFGTLAQSINVKPIKGEGYKIFVGVEYGAYVEFGTGKKVNIPSEMKDIASRFKGSPGSFKEGLKAIKDWVKSKGIPESAAYPILVSLIVNGQSAQPYLYPAFLKGRKLLLQDLKDYIDDFTIT